MITEVGTYKIFKFEHSEGNEIIAADNAQDAIIHYFTKCQDDMDTEGIIEFGGLTIEELDQMDITINRTIEREFVSYADLAEEHFQGSPVVLASSYLTYSGRSLLSQVM